MTKIHLIQSFIPLVQLEAHKGSETASCSHWAHRWHALQEPKEHHICWPQCPQP